MILTVPELENTTKQDDFSPYNWYGEVKFSARPLAQAYCDRHPRTKLIETTWADIVINGYKTADTLIDYSEIKPGFIFGRMNSVASNAENLKDIENKNAGIIYGLDKPSIIHDNLSTAQGFFPEGSIRFFTYCTKSNNFPANQTHEMFYWTPDLPELAIRGWYELIRLCNQNSVVKTAHDKNTDVNDRMNIKMSRYVQDTIRAMLYPSFDATIWQPEKQVEWGFFMTHDISIIKILNERGIQWQDKLNEVLGELLNTVGEDNLVIGNRSAQNTGIWLNRFINDGVTVLDFKASNGPFINLDPTIMLAN